MKKLSEERILAAELLAACKEVLPVLEVALRAGLRGMTKDEGDTIVAGHGTCQKLRRAIARAEGKQ